MTEDEAKTKWCPFARIICDSIDGKTHVGPFNRMTLNTKPDETRIPPSGNCIGSDCMAWRIKDYGLDKENNPVPYGYCGLAGISRLPSGTL